MSNVTAPPFDDDDAREAVDGQVDAQDADTVDGQEPSDIRLSLGSENGTVSFSGYGLDTVDISFSGRYDEGAAIISTGPSDPDSGGSSSQADSGVQTIQTDTDGYITGFTLVVAHNSTSPTIRWWVFGETA